MRILEFMINSIIKPTSPPNRRSDSLIVASSRYTGMPSNGSKSRCSSDCGHLGLPARR